MKRRLAALFLLGLLLGATLTTLWASRRMDVLYREGEELKSQLLQKTLLVEELTKEVQKKKAPPPPLTIQEVELRLRPAKNAEVFSHDMEKVLIPQLHRTFVGKKLENLDLELAAAVLDGKTLTIHEKTFRLEVESILAAPRTVIGLRVTLSGERP